MSRPSNPDRHNAIADIKILCSKHGRVEGTRKARAKYTHIPAPTWHRWLAEAIADSPFADAKTAAADLAAEVSKHVPAPGTISPAVAAAKPAAAARAIDLFQQMSGLFDDADLLRDYSLKPSENGGVAIKTPKFFMDAARLRAEILRTATALQQSLYDMKRMQEFFDTILSEIADCDAEVAGKIHRRLAALNAQRGWTSSA